jgi:hypothetical protein
MRLKLLYTLVLILCMSAFASSKNECTHPVRDSGQCDKGTPVKELSKEISEEKQEFSTFQFVKFLYI